MNCHRLMEPATTVLQTLKNTDKPLKGAEIAEICGLDKKAFDKAVKQLKTEDLIEVPKRCFYAAK